MAVIETTRFRQRCKHGKYLLDESLNTIECGICKEKLNPIWVLGQMCNTENRYNMELDRQRELVKKASKKNRCKCEKCGEMTRIQK